uniref:Uncharacterized protein n=1 Tax=Caenorhabditis tropicalis TaxID=1561998 RepID=A0A1I7TBN7_9PELO
MTDCVPEPFERVKDMSRTEGVKQADLQSIPHTPKIKKMGEESPEEVKEKPFDPTTLPFEYLACLTPEQCKAICQPLSVFCEHDLPDPKTFSVMTETEDVFTPEVLEILEKDRQVASSRVQIDLEKLSLEENALKEDEPKSTTSDK